MLPSFRALLPLDAGPGAAASLLVQLPPPFQGKAINRIAPRPAMSVTRGLREDATVGKVSEIAARGWRSLGGELGLSAKADCPAIVFLS